MPWKLSRCQPNRSPVRRCRVAMARPRPAQSGGPPTRSSTRTRSPTPSTAGTGAPAAASAVRPSASTSAGYGQRLTTTSCPSASRPRVVLQMNPPLSGSAASSGGRPGGQSASLTLQRRQQQVAEERGHDQHGQQDRQGDGQAAAVDPDPGPGVDRLVGAVGGIGPGRGDHVEEVVDLVGAVVGPVGLEPAAAGQLPDRDLGLGVVAGSGLRGGGPLPGRRRLGRGRLEHGLGDLGAAGRAGVAPVVDGLADGAAPLGAHGAPVSLRRSSSLPTSRRLGSAGAGAGPAAVRSPRPLRRLGALGAAGAGGPARTAVVVVGVRMPIRVVWVSAMVGLAAGSASSIRSTSSTTGAGRVAGGNRRTSPARAATPAYWRLPPSKAGRAPVRYSA